MPEETQNQQKIEKPWAVILEWPYYLGRIKEERDTGSLLIQDSEGQQYFPFPWGSDIVERCSDYKEAIEHYMTLKGDTSDREKLIRLIQENFPKAIKQECYQRMHDILSAYAQTLPKCTEPTSKRRGFLDSMIKVTP